tara:strand:- start:193 stop:342 length:150 start_codon:yes stop_codon:yes gene_type:complete
MIRVNISMDKEIKRMGYEKMRADRYTNFSAWIRSLILRRSKREEEEEDD